MLLYRVTSKGFTEKCEKLHWSTTYLNGGRKQPCECLREEHWRPRKQNCACPEIRECVCVGRTARTSVAEGRVVGDEV